MNWHFGSGCVNQGSEMPCPYRRDIAAVLNELVVAGKRGRARSGLERAIRTRAEQELGWDIGARAAQRKFAGTMDELIRHGVRIPCRGNRRGSLTFCAPENGIGGEAE